MKNILWLVLCLCCTTVTAQYNIGTRTVTFNDPARTGGFGSGAGPGRQVQCEVYYPATAAGTSTPFAAGAFPVIVFGHGFVMAWDAYQNIWERLVPQGYIMVFPRTEGSFSPSHNDFGLDLALVEQKMQAEGASAASFFYQHITDRSAIMGHSMGGGSTVLAAQNNTHIKTIVCLAPAETSPSAITAAPLVPVPALVMSGVQDGVTPPADHHLPIYNALGSTCKTLISIPGGGHCYFANTNFNCDFGEATSSSGISISRAQQQDISADLYSIWFDFYLKQQCSARQAFSDSLDLSGRIVATDICAYVPPALGGTISPSTSGTNGAVDAVVSGGSAPYAFDWSSGQNTEDITGLAPGTYTLTVTDDYGCQAVQDYTVGTVTGYAAVSTQWRFGLFPNPAAQTVTIDFNATPVLEVKVYTPDGRCVYGGNMGAGESLDVSGWSRGVYLVHARGHDRVEKVVRLVKE